MLDCLAEPADQVAVIVALFSRLVDLENLDDVLRLMPRAVINEVVSRLGWLNIFSPLKPSMRYEISLQHLDARRFVHVLLAIAAAESGGGGSAHGGTDGQALREDATTDVMISELYAQISQLVSNPSTNVARFRYDVKKPMWMSRIHFLKARERTRAPPLPEKIVAL